jgi:hypothetical protein
MLFYTALNFSIKEKMIRNIELLKRHKIARDAGILSQDEFMQLYQSIMNEDSNNQLVSLSLTSAITFQPNKPAIVKDSLFHQAGSPSLFQSSSTTSVIPIASEDCGPDVKDILTKGMVFA